MAMETYNNVLFFILTNVFLLVSAFTNVHADQSVRESSIDRDGRRTYIIRVRPPLGFTDYTSRLDLERWYESFLVMEPGSTETGGRPLLVHSYRAAMTGFAAKLTEAEAASVAAKDGVLGVFPSYLMPLHTTHSPDFLGLRSAGVNRHAGAWDGVLGRKGEGVVIAVLDTMVNPTHLSFRDDGMSAPPDRWRGECNFWGERVPCNKKIIGGRTIFSELKDGHGTHTASTAAGNFVAGAGVLGNGNGTATGMAPRAHLAIYEVCSDTNCDAADVLAGMDSAISDGADVLSLSLGGSSRPFYNDTIAIGAFSAMAKGIFVSCSAGNEGPDPSSLGNDAPWILTVGASTMDRRMHAVVKLGNGMSFVGESAYRPNNLPPTPLVTPIGRSIEDDCKPGLPGLAGKIAVIEDVCLDRVRTGILVKNAGGVGMVLTGDEADGNTTFADAHVLPASYVSYLDGEAIRKYMNSTKDPVAEIAFHGTSFEAPSSAPAVASISSRGPSLTTPGIVKPDIIGPGVNVIAAWPFKDGPEGNNGGDIKDFSDVTFDILSGTSMSAPHLSGIVALIKSEHPDWSPAMIKSAIMTTADTARSDGKPVLDEKQNTAAAFAMGAGHVNPSKAVDPGLVYDIDEAQYIAYICGLGYTDDQVEIITHKRGACGSTRKITGAELNYPSIVARLSAGKITVNQTLTNVDVAPSKYTLEVNVPKGVAVMVSPLVLEFRGQKDKKSFTVRMSWDAVKMKHVEGSLKWVSKTHVVRIPIVIF